jgi:hypothetical protein
MKRTLAWIACCGGAAYSLAAGAPPEPATVAMPLRDYQALYEAARGGAGPAPKAPPVPHAVTSARFDLAWRDGSVEGVAEFDVVSLAEGWGVVPLIGADARIARVDPPGTRLAVVDGSVALLVERAGSTTVKLEFAAELSEAGERRELRLPVAAAVAGELRLRGVAPGQRVEVAGATPSDGEPGALVYRLAGSGCLSLAVAPPPPPEAPSRWAAERWALARFADGRLDYRCRLSAVAEGGSGVAMEIRIPAGSIVQSVAGEDLASWRAEAGTLRVRWKTAGRLARDLDIAYQLAQPAAEGSWTLRAPEVVGGKNAPAQFALAVDPEIEATPTTPGAGRLPRGLMAEAGKSASVMVGGDGSVAVRWLPKVATPDAVVGSARFAMRLVADGALLGEGTVVVRHEGPFAWRVELPAGSSLLSCSVNGAPVEPLDRGGGVIEFALGAAGPKSSSEVRLAFIGRRAAFHPVSGQVEVELPRTDLLAHSIDWEIALPEGYRLAALDGNLAGVAGSKPGLVALRKELCQGERPSARLFYEKPDALQ